MLGIEYPAPYIAFIMVFIGILLRSLFPYIKKLREAAKTPVATAPEFKWDHRYSLTIISNMAISFVATMLLFATWSPPDGTLFQVAFLAFITGWGSQDIFNSLVA